MYTAGATGSEGCTCSPMLATGTVLGSSGFVADYPTEAGGDAVPLWILHAICFSLHGQCGEPQLPALSPR